MRDNKYNDEHFWTNSIENARHRAWSGYAFEQVGLAHIKQIKERLGIAGVLTNVASWRSQESDPGAQIDLLIDRNDNVINLCEMKFSIAEFVIDKKYDETLRNKKAAFLRKTKTRKAIHQTMVTTYGVKRNEYSGQVQSDVKMEDLFTVLNIFCTTHKGTSAIEVADEQKAFYDHFLFYIKSQHENAGLLSAFGCFLFLFYIKSQPPRSSRG